MQTKSIINKFKELGYEKANDEKADEDGDYFFLKHCPEAPCGRVIWIDNSKKSVSCYNMLTGSAQLIGFEELALISELAKNLGWYEKQ